MDPPSGLGWNRVATLQHKHIACVVSHIVEASVKFPKCIHKDSFKRVYQPHIASMSFQTSYVRRGFGCSPVDYIHESDTFCNLVVSSFLCFGFGLCLDVHEYSNKCGPEWGNHAYVSKDFLRAPSLGPHLL